KTIALLVAAGKSERLKSDLPKPYLLLGGEPIVRHAVKAFISHPAISGVRVVIRREHHPHYRKAVEGLTLFPCVVGGDSRQESVRLGLQSIMHHHPDYVLVHDVARPMVSGALIQRVVDALSDRPAVIPAVPITDTIKHAEDGKITDTISREHLYAAQT